uniref:Serine/threonine specific protein phosphatases domain-containing protein n=2 Tax=Biomphalaria glabrata TaxID=6526 RepID=A0A2C9LTV8_BIOGL
MPRRTIERQRTEVPAPFTNILGFRELFGKQNVPDLDLLRVHLANQGRLDMVAIREILDRTTIILSKESNLLLINGNVTVVGALHGHFYDLLTILKKNQTVPNTKLLFLGSYVHNGNFGVETVIFLLTMKLLNPNQVFLLRGSQDCRTVAELQFKQECLTKYCKLAFYWIMDAFDSLPLAAVVNGNVFCVHGGISSRLKSMQDIEKINRFREPPKKGLFTDLLWSDLNYEETEDGNQMQKRFSFNQDRRISVYFSLRALFEFLYSNNFRLLVRSNQLLSEGAYFHGTTDDGTIRYPFVSLCSASNVMNYRNKGGYLFVTPTTVGLRQIAWVPQPYILPNGMNAFDWSLSFLMKKVVLILADLLDVEEGLLQIDIKKHKHIQTLKSQGYPLSLLKIDRKKLAAYIAQREKERTQILRIEKMSASENRIRN